MSNIKLLALIIILFLLSSFSIPGEVTGKEISEEDNTKTEFQVRELKEEETTEEEKQDEVPVEQSYEYEFNSAEEISLGGFGQMTGGLKANYGPQIGLLWFDFSSINSLLENSDSGFVSLPEDVFFKGSGGVAGFKPGIRIGYSRMGGSTGSVGVSNEEKRKILFDFSYSGFMFEQGIYGEADTDIALGGLAGSGNTSLDFIYGIPVEFDLDGSGSQTRLSQDFFVFKPYISLNHRFSGFMGLNMSAGYLFSFSRNGWEIADQTVSTPFADLQAPEIKIGIYLGF